MWDKILESGGRCRCRRRRRAPQSPGWKREKKKEGDRGLEQDETNPICSDRHPFVPEGHEPTRALSPLHSALVLEHGEGISRTVYVDFVVLETSISFYILGAMGWGKTEKGVWDVSFTGHYSAGVRPTLPATAASTAMRLVTGNLFLSAAFKFLLVA